MAATAPPATTVRDDAPDAHEVRDPTEVGDSTSAVAEAPGTSHTSMGGFDDLFVQPVDPPHDRGSLPALPGGWRHAGLVQLMARQPRERRETMLAGGFALAAVLWGPLGVLAFMTRNALLFGVLSITAAILAVVPRPALGGETVGGVADAAGAALERLGPALASARERLAPLVARIGQRLATLVARLGERVATSAAHLGERLAPLGPRLRVIGDRVVAVMRDVGRRAAGRLRSADRSVAATVRRGLEGLHSGGGDHSSPSSAR